MIKIFGKVSPVRMFRTGETLFLEKHVRIKFHQYGTSVLVKLTPIGQYLLN